MEVKWLTIFQRLQLRQNVWLNCAQSWIKHTFAISQTALRSFRRRLRHSSMHKVLAAKVTAGKVGNTAMLLLQAHSKNKFINFKIKRHIKLIYITLQWARWRLESSCKSMQTRRILAISLHLESVLANITLEEWHGMRDFTYNLDVNSTSW